MEPEDLDMPLLITDKPVDGEEGEEYDPDEDRIYNVTPMMVAYALRGQAIISTVDLYGHVFEVREDLRDGGVTVVHLDSMEEHTFELLGETYICIARIINELEERRG